MLSFLSASSSFMAQCLSGLPQTSFFPFSFIHYISQGSVYEFCPQWWICSSIVCTYSLFCELRNSGKCLGATHRKSQGLNNDWCDDSIHTIWSHRIRQALDSLVKRGSHLYGKTKSGSRLLQYTGMGEICSIATVVGISSSPFSSQETTPLTVHKLRPTRHNWSGVCFPKFLVSFSPWLPELTSYLQTKLKFALQLVSVL